MKYIKIPQDELLNMDGNELLIFRLLLSLVDDSGKCECSIRDISRDTGISFYNIRKSLLKCKRYKITNRAPNKRSIFEIIGYNDYFYISNAKPIIPNKVKPKEASLDFDNEEHKFRLGMQESYPQVMKLKKPLDFKGYIELQEKYSVDEIKEALTNMDNYKPLLSKYIDAKRTIVNWIKNSRRK